METEKSLQNFAPTGSCPVRDVLCRLGDKWSMLVLLTLDANGVMRFSEIHRTLGDISHRMLTVTLRMLETDRDDPPRSLCRGSAAGGIQPYGAGREPSAAYFSDWWSGPRRTRRLFWTAAGDPERHPPGIRAVGVVAAQQPFVPEAVAGVKALWRNRYRCALRASLHAARAAGPAR